MPGESAFDFVLWAIPRFRRPYDTNGQVVNVTPMRQAAGRQAAGRRDAGTPGGFGHAVVLTKAMRVRAKNAARKARAAKP